MEIKNNKGEVVGSINTSYISGKSITTNTIYDNGQPVMQSIVSRDNHGNSETTNVFGKILP
jgi:hypothetical protein